MLGCNDEKTWIQALTCTSWPSLAMFKWFQLVYVDGIVELPPQDASMNFGKCCGGGFRSVAVLMWQSLALSFHVMARAQFSVLVPAHTINASTTQPDITISTTCTKQQRKVFSADILFATLHPDP